MAFVDWGSRGTGSAGHIQGDISVGGFPKDQTTFARVSGYVEQVTSCALLTHHRDLERLLISSQRPRMGFLAQFLGENPSKKLVKICVIGVYRECSMPDLPEACA